MKKFTLLWDGHLLKPNGMTFRHNSSIKDAQYISNIAVGSMGNQLFIRERARTKATPHKTIASE